MRSSVMRKIQMVAIAVALGAVSGNAQDPAPQARAVELRNLDRALQLVVTQPGAAVSDAFAGPVVKNRPVSATETRSTIQTLANGTHIESSESSRLFRDVDGRTRVEGK